MVRNVWLQNTVGLSNQAGKETTAFSFYMDIKSDNSLEGSGWPNLS